MDADGAFRAKRLVHVHRFFRADMVAAHQLARAEGTDCEQRQPWPPPLGGFSHPASIAPAGDRKSAVEGKRVYVRVDLGGRRIIQKQQHISPYLSII